MSQKKLSWGRLTCNLLHTSWPRGSHPTNSRGFFLGLVFHKTPGRVWGCLCVDFGLPEADVLNALLVKRCFQCCYRMWLRELRTSFGGLGRSKTNPKRDQNSRNHILTGTGGYLCQQHAQHKSAPSQPQNHRKPTPKPNQHQPRCQLRFA